MNHSKKLNILVTIFDLHFGGISNLILQTVPAFKEELNIEVVYFGKREEMLQRFLDKGIVTTQIPYRGWKDVFRAGRELSRLIKDKEIDIVSTNLFVDKVITTIARRFADFKILGTFHSVNDPYTSTNVQFKLKSKFEDYFHNNIVDKNFAVSKASLESWRNYRSLKHDNTSILYSGIKELNCRNTPHPNNELPKDKIFVTACRLTSEKGLERLITLFKEVNHHTKRWQFWIIGDGPLKSQLEILVQELGLENQILFQGFQTDLCKFYKNAHFYINGSFQEALPVSILEAMSAGLPVVGSEVGGIPEVIDNGVNGFLVNFDKREEGLLVLRKCININEQDYWNLSKNSIGCFNSRFSIGHYTKSYKKEIESLMEKG